MIFVISYGTEDIRKVADTVWRTCTRAVERKRKILARVPLTSSRRKKRVLEERRAYEKTPWTLSDLWPKINQAFNKCASPIVRFHSRAPATRHFCPRIFPEFMATTSREIKRNDNFLSCRRSVRINDMKIPFAWNFVSNFNFKLRFVRPKTKRALICRMKISRKQDVIKSFVCH